ncbi:transcription antitermination factor NusB [Desulforhabdus sp. TSK]|uniref:transcription antitermination factor NusB n=1 Tax=Desulforhabdus sp. TSK TaxID=2925014 RepID=UPI001FC8C5D4|nr:transcription antitermination factor NusB [Desulforhabdus sp. TSK]
MKSKVSRRRRSREIALQVLYAMEMSETPPEQAMELYYRLFEDDEDLDVDIPMEVRPFAEKLIMGVELHQSELDALIGSASQHWRLYRMPVVDRNILRIALFEMLHCPDIPPKVSINEAVELGKHFGSEDSGAFINGILDHILPELDDKRPKTAPDE